MINHSDTMTYYGHWPRYQVMLQFPRVMLLSEPEFDLSINDIYVSGHWLTFVHLDVYYFSPGVLKQLMKLWRQVKLKLPEIVYCHAETPGPKFDKFVSLFNWKPLVEARCTDGTIRMIYYQFTRND